MTDLWCISRFILDSDGRSYVTLNIYENKELANAAYEELKKTFFCYTYQDEYKNMTYKEKIEKAEEGEQVIIEDTDNLDNKYIGEEGGWKRPSGFNMFKLSHVKSKEDDKINGSEQTRSDMPLPMYSNHIKSWPDIRTYE